MRPTSESSLNASQNHFIVLKMFFLSFSDDEPVSCPTSKKLNVVLNLNVSGARHRSIMASLHASGTTCTWAPPSRRMPDDWNVCFVNIDGTMTLSMASTFATHDGLHNVASTPAVTPTFTRARRGSHSFGSCTWTDRSKGPLSSRDLCISSPTRPSLALRSSIQGVIPQGVGATVRSTSSRWRR